MNMMAKHIHHGSDHGPNHKTKNWEFQKELKYKKNILETKGFFFP